MKVLLVNPPGPTSQRLSRGLMGGYGMQTGSALVYPPIQLAYMAAVLERDGHGVAIYDAEARGDNAEGVIEAARAGASEMIVLSCSQDAFGAELELCRRLRGCAPAGVCLIGPMAYTHLDRCFAEGDADWVLVGEPDLAIATLIADVARGRSPAAPGIVFRSGAEVVTNPGSNRVADLDALPLPARHLLDHYLYRYPGDPRPMTTIHASRGCPIDCPFCAYVFTEGKAQRLRSPSGIVREMEQAQRDHGTALVVFRDPIFTLSRSHVLELCAQLAERSLAIDWICETALRFVDPPLLARMRAAGCVGLSFGVESGNDALQRKYARNKIGSKAHAVEIVRACRRLGIRTRAFFMLGFPEETEAMRKETVEFAVRLDPDTVQFVPVTRYAGTPLHDDGHPMSDLDRHRLGRSVRRAYRRFYGRPRRLLTELRAPRALLRRTAAYLSLPG